MSNVYLAVNPNENDLSKALGSFAQRIALEYGDILFGGVDDTGEPITVSIERKKIRDLTSCVIDGRLLYQLQRATAAGMSRLQIIVEGEVKPDTNGHLMTRHGIRGREKNPKNYLSGLINPKRNFSGSWYTIEPIVTYNHWDSYLSQLHRMCGVEIKRSANVAETAAIIRSQWLLYQKPMPEHHSLKTVYQQPAPYENGLLKVPSLMRRVCKELPGIGYERSLAVEQRFKTVEDMVSASIKDWEGIEGIGKVVAQRAYQALHSKES